jgi:serine/threonine/tyrosine-interacting protein
MTVVRLPESNPHQADVDVQGEDALKVLQYITTGCYEASSSEWEYESRRVAQRVLPYLYLGPFTMAKDVKYLTREGITMLLVVRDEKSALSGLLSGKKVADQLGIPHAAIDVAGGTELIQYGFRTAIHLINNHLLERYQACAPPGPLPSGPPFVDDPPAYGKVLIFCESGNDRSAAVFASYLMATYEIDLVSALQFLQAHRFCIAPTDDLKNLLLNFQDLLEARRGVTGAGSAFDTDGNPTGGLGQIRKRTIDEVDGDNSDAGDESGEPDDAARFESRSKSSAPFHG